MLFFPLHASRNLVTFPSCPQALEKRLEMWQDFGLCVRNLLLACEKPPSKFCHVICLRRDKSSCSQVLVRAGQLKKNPPELYSSLTALCEPPPRSAPEPPCMKPSVAAQGLGLVGVSPRGKVPPPRALLMPGSSNLSSGTACGKAEGAGGGGEGRGGLGWD